MDANLVQMRALVNEAASSAANLAGPLAQAHAGVSNALGGLAEVERKLLQAKGAGLNATKLDTALKQLRDLRDALNGAVQLAEQRRGEAAALHATITSLAG